MTPYRLLRALLLCGEDTAYADADGVWLDPEKADELPVDVDSVLLDGRFDLKRAAALLSEEDGET